MIERVEGLKPEVERMGLPDVGVLRKGGVKILASGSEQSISALVPWPPDQIRIGVIEGRWIPKVVDGAISPQSRLRHQPSDQNRPEDFHLASSLLDLTFEEGVWTAWLRKVEADWCTCGQ
jgi:hypothetical protein